MNNVRLLLILCLAFPAYLPCSGAPFDSAREPLRAARRTQLQFPDGNKIIVDVVDTSADRERGLMFRKKLPRDYGMLFVFPAESTMQFWMKNTWASLDILFIGRDKMITRLYPRVKPSTPFTSDESVARVRGWGQYVLELPAGAAARHKLKEGQFLEFSVPPAQR